MNRMKTLGLVMAVLSITSPVFASTVTDPAASSIAVSASVSDVFSIRTDIRRDIAGFPDVADTAIAFGNLVVSGGTLVAAEGRVAFINVINTAGTQYTVSSNIATPLTRTGGTETIPNGAFVLNVNETTPANPGTATDPANTAVGNFTIFTSDAPGSESQVEAHYTITNDPALGATSFVPQNQRSGTYTTTLVISATRP